MKNETPRDQASSAAEHGKCMMSRRKFLLGSAATVAAAGVASTMSITLFPGTAHARKVEAQVMGYPRTYITDLSKLKANEPFDFNYPDENANSSAFVVNLGGVKAGGGIGPRRDVVAYSYVCTHQGGPLQGGYKAVGKHRVMGQCPLHLSTYDLTRHGIVVSGQAYQSLPQVLLELDGDKIYAVGIMGLLFGRHKNLLDQA